MQLYEYQEHALAFMDKYPASYLALDMGMGKTAIALTWIKKTLAAKPQVKAALVVAPLRTVLTTWPEEASKWAPNLSIAVLHGADKAKTLNSKADIYLINFEGLTWLLRQLKVIYKQTRTVPFRMLVIDEGSLVKSHKAKRFDALKTLLPVFNQYRTIMSGTPAPNSVIDLWSQYFLLDGGLRLGKCITHFRNQYCAPHPRCKHQWVVKDPFQTELVYQKVKDITYRLDAADYLSLPERIDNVIKIQLSPSARQAYVDMEKKFQVELEEGGANAFNQASKAMKLRQIVQGAIYEDREDPDDHSKREYDILHTRKLEALEDLMEEASGQGILCAIQFRFELDMILSKFPDAPVVAGGTKASDTVRYIRMWNAGELPLLLCHPASLSHGVNLQAGSHIILWYGLTWSLEHYLQFNARLHRNGQKRAVIVHHLVAEHTIDERVMLALKNKFKNQSEFLNYLKGVHDGVD